MSDISNVLAERGSRYGRFDDHARLTQQIKYIFTWGNNWEALPYDAKEALEMIAHKIGRILNGDPNYADSWVDIAGYSKLVADRILKEGEYAEPKPQDPRDDGQRDAGQYNSLYNVAFDDVRGQWHTGTPNY